MSFRIPWAKPEFLGKEREYLLEAFDSTWVSGGPYVERFEADFAELHRPSRCVTTSNGTTALQLALLGLGIGPGDEVILPGFSFVAAGNMVLAVGAQPVFADVEEDTWCLDPNSVAERITERTRAILPVHSYGNLCDMEALLSIAEERGCAVVEDVAEATFSKYAGAYAGTFGAASCFSFQATKTIAMGEGGAVLTQDEQLLGQMRLIRDHGMRKSRRYFHDAIGFNFRLPNLQAAIGCAQLEQRAQIVARREHVANRYREVLGAVEGIVLQAFRSQVEPVVWATALRLDPGVFGDRSTLIDNLTAQGIETRPGFYPYRLMEIYSAPPLPVSEQVGASILCLPSFSTLQDDEIDFICDCLLAQRR